MATFDYSASTNRMILTTLHLPLAMHISMIILPSWLTCMRSAILWMYCCLLLLSPPNVKPSLFQKSTCTRLKAVQMQNTAKFKNSVITGVFAIQCRHRFFLRMVDLQKGERYYFLLYHNQHFSKSKGTQTRIMRWHPHLQKPRTIHILCLHMTSSVSIQLTRLQGSPNGFRMWLML